MSCWAGALSRKNWKSWKALMSGLKRETKTEWPSEDQAGEMKTLLSERVERGRGWEPSASAIQRLSLPERSLMKAMCAPSGE